MLSVNQISEAIDELSHGFSVADFERWLRRDSRNVHAWGSEYLKQAVLAVEAVLSEFQFANMEEGAAKLELVKAIRPFVVHDVGDVAAYTIPIQTGTSSADADVPRKPLGSAANCWPPFRLRAA